MKIHSHKKNFSLLVVLMLICGIIILMIHKNKIVPVSGESGSISPISTPLESLAPEKNQPATDIATELTSANIIWFTNNYRVQHGLNPLTLSSQLRNSAYYKSQDMFRHNYFAHERPSNGMGFDNFIDNQGYDFIKIAENLARGEFATSKSVVDAWINSPTHRANILDASYTEIGVSVDRGTLDGKEVTVITQHFGKPRNICPGVDEALHAQIQSMNRQLTNLKKKIDLDDGDVESLIQDYNTIIRSRVPLVAKYNTQVIAFDACITKGR